MSFVLINAFSERILSCAVIPLHAIGGTDWQMRAAANAAERRYYSQQRRKDCGADAAAGGTGNQQEKSPEVSPRCEWLFFGKLSILQGYAKTRDPMRLTASPERPPHCPYCWARMTPAQKTLAGNPWFPFCSARCKMADLSKWFDGAYAIEQPLASLTDEQCQDLPAPAVPADE